MKAILTIAAVLIAFIQASAADKSADAKHVDAQQAAKLVQEKKVTVLDIRTPEEFKEGHIEGAKNIDFNGGSFEAEIAKLDKAKPYLVHCRSGGRSGKSLPTFKKLGFTNIHHLDGGIMAWEAAKQPVAK